MAYSNGSAADYPALIAMIRDFIAGIGWTINTDGAASGFLTATNSNGNKFYLTTATSTQNDVVSGSFTDREMRCAADLANVGGTAGASAYYARSNDWLGPFSNVWLFGTGKYVHIVAQVSARRYNHFSFGDIDPKQIHSSNIGYAAGVSWVYWRHTTVIGDYVGNNPQVSNHRVGFFCEDGPNNNGDSHIRINLPDGLVDPALFFNDGIIERASLRDTCSRYWTQGQATSGDRFGAYHDFFAAVKNHSFTGGVPITPMPVLHVGNSDNVHAYIGEFPDVGLVNMAGLSPGQVITFADDDWLVFPLKEFGTEEHAAGGLSPIFEPNSVNYGFAYKRIV